MLQPPSTTLGAYLLMVAHTHQNCAFFTNAFLGINKVNTTKKVLSQTMVEDCK
jgi:hypothetical protein